MNIESFEKLFIQEYVEDLESYQENYKHPFKEKTERVYYGHTGGIFFSDSKLQNKVKEYKVYGDAGCEAEIIYTDDVKEAAIFLFLQQYSGECVDELYEILTVTEPEKRKQEINEFRKEYSQALEDHTWFWEPSKGFPVKQKNHVSIHEVVTSMFEFEIEGDHQGFWSKAFDLKEASFEPLYYGSWETSYKTIMGKAEDKILYFYYATS